MRLSSKIVRHDFNFDPYCHFQDEKICFDLRNTNVPYLNVGISEIAVNLSNVQNANCSSVSRRAHENKNAK